ncbi:hypothetical protein FHW02_004527 [Ochrobactrum sp. RH1CCR137]|jgi:hypothetical protein|nr:hypothetical protein [Ochrobactrum sp. RH1CCR137]MBA8858321.1 hypothetical protein [Ochrobactrum sp. RH1CCR134]
MTDNLRGFSFFYDLTVRHHDEPISDFRSEGNFMRDNDHCHTVPSQLAHYGEDLQTELRIKR